MTVNKPLTEEDQKQIDESMAESKPAPIGNPEYEVDESALANVEEKSKSVAVRGGGINIEGLQDVPASVIPVPFVRLVQGQSKKIDLEDGKEAPEGTFYFNDIKQCFAKLSFIMLRAKHQIVEFEREENGRTVKKPTKQILILGITTDTKKLFILALSVMSFSNFGRLVNMFKTAQISRTWEYEIIASAAKEENDKGKFWTQDYKLGEKLSSEQIDEMAEVYGEYGGVLDRDYTQEDMEQTA